MAVEKLQQCELGKKREKYKQQDKFEIIDENCAHFHFSRHLFVTSHDDEESHLWPAFGPIVEPDTMESMFCKSECFVFTLCSA